MAELFINPLVPLPIVVSGFTQTTSPIAGFVMTSDADGVGTWQATNAHGDNITINNSNPILTIENSAGNSNGATLSLESKSSQGTFDFKQLSAGGGSITNYADVGPITVTTGAAGDLSLISVSGEVKTQGTAVRLNAATVTAYNSSSSVVASDNGAVTQITSITNPVTLNSRSGKITTIVPAIAAGSWAQFDLNNNFITDSSTLIIAWIAGYDLLGNGIPMVNIDRVAAGLCTFRLGNAHATLSLDEPVKVGFIVL